MTEHDAPTVARAMIWLDTSSDTPTRPEQYFDDDATTCVRRIATAETKIQTKTHAFGSSFGGQETFTAFQHGPTEVFERAEVPRPLWLRLAKQSGSPRALRCLFVAALVASAFALGQRTTSSTHTKSVAAPPTVAPPAARAPAVTPQPVARPAEPTSVALAAANAPVHASEREAVEALARGDYPRALVFYRALADEHPLDAAFPVIEQLLTDRVNPPCASGERKSGPCGG